MSNPALIENERTLPFAREEVFRAFADPGRLARWWGPAGFTNEIHAFELRPGGRWRLTMTAPDGTRFENTSRFEEIEPPARIVYRHEDPVHAFRMSIRLEPAGERATRLTWRMAFDDPEEARRVRAVVAAANEQNFDRLQQHLASDPSSA